jgi:hypothetical protein
MINNINELNEAKMRLTYLEDLIENGEDDLDEYIEANSLSYSIRQYETKEALK